MLISLLNTDHERIAIAAEMVTSIVPDDTSSNACVVRVADEESHRVQGTVLEVMDQINTGLELQVVLPPDAE